MNNLLKITYDLKRILTRSNPTKDTRIEDAHLYYLIAKYRANWIREYYMKTSMTDDDIDRQWLQFFPKLKVTELNTFENEEFCCGEQKVGKLRLPQLVNLPGDSSLFRIASYSNTRPFDRININEFMKRIDPDVQINRGKPRICSRVGTMLYIFPYEKEIKATLILDDPIDGVCFENVYVQNNILEPGVTYKVFENSISHNSIPRLPGSTFVAVNNSYSGNGAVKRLNETELMKVLEAYPLSMEMLPKITLDICTKEFGIEMRTIPDTKNDYKDQAIQP